MQVNTQFFFGVGGQVSATHGLARFCLADFQDVLPGRCRSKVMVKADDAMYICAGQIQLASKLANGGLTNEAEAIHEGMQNLSGAEPNCSAISVATALSNLIVIPEYLPFRLYPVRYKY